MQKQRSEDEAQRDICLAYAIADLTRRAKLPKLDTLLKGGQRKQTVGEQYETVAALANQYGYKLRKGIKGRVVRFG